MTAHLIIALIIAAILIIFGAFVFVAGIMKSAGRADEQLEHIEPGDLMDTGLMTAAEHAKQDGTPTDELRLRRTKLQGNG